MAVGQTGRQNVVVAGALHPEYAQVLQTYSDAQGYDIVRVKPGPDGRVDPQRLGEALGESTAAVILQQPNFYGLIEDPHPVVELAHGAGALAAAKDFDAIAHFGVVHFAQRLMAKIE